ncbi:MAG: MMPL family transporter, partial [Planctomycetota bacterium]
MRWRVAVLVAAVAVAVALAFAVPALRVGFRIDGFFRSDDPVLQEAMGHYGDPGFEPPDRLLLFGWDEPEPTGVPSVQRLAGFTAVLQQEPLVERVLTLANVAVPGALRSSPEQVAKSATWRHLLVSRQGDAVAGIVVLRPGYHGAALPPLFARLRAAAAAAGRELRLCGLPYHTSESRELIQADMARFLPIGTAVSAALLFWLVPHWLLACLALVVVPMTLASTLGVMAWCGIEMTMLTSTLPTLLLCMSVADGVHLVGRFLEERARDGDAKLAAARTFAAMFVPCLMTSLTTIVGFLTLVTARLVDLRWLGVFAAVGMG